MRLAVVVTPKAGRDEIVGWKGSELHVKVTVAPEGGRANALVCRIVADALGVPKSAVAVVRGDTARHKQLEIIGASEADVASALGSPDARPR